ncbi:excisionase family DNA-binding protein [Kitasatospora sp. NPDC051705]|uniref:excisionase family DNA-binding protein n=1 Tax=Kitasatospora sp. NPDC051705 TaxID=3364057 RepID=UPI0037B283AD
MSAPTPRLLTVGQAAECLATGERFIRRLIAERRIAFVRIGRHIRIPASAIEAFISDGTVHPITVTSLPGRAA